MKPIVLSALGAALILAGTAHAGEPGGRGHPPRGGYPGGGSINVNVSAQAHAQASANAGASAMLGARSWSSGASSVRYGGGGGAAYVHGGYYEAESYGVGGGYGLHVIRADAHGPAPVSAPFGYAVYGFGRDYGRQYAPPVQYEAPQYYEGREVEYGYESSESYRYEEAYVEGGYEQYERYEDDRGDASYHDRGGCDCEPDQGRSYDEAPPYAEPYDYGPPPAPYHAAPPQDYYGDLPPPGYVSPQAPPPNHDYRQEPGERG